MLTFVKQYAFDEFSQNGEDGILEEVVKRILTQTPDLPKRCAEIGAYDGHTYSNTARLIKAHGWGGLMIESNRDLFRKCDNYWQDFDRVTCTMLELTPKNVDWVIPRITSLLSLDIDGGEIEIFRNLRFKPEILVIEIDSSIDPTDGDTRNAFGGVGYLQMVRYAIHRGYFLLAHVGNCIFVDMKYAPLFPEITADPITQWELFFNQGWLGTRLS